MQLAAFQGFIAGAAHAEATRTTAARNRDTNSTILLEKEFESAADLYFAQGGPNARRDWSKLAPTDIQKYLDIKTIKKQFRFKAPTIRRKIRDWLKKKISQRRE